MSRREKIIELLRQLSKLHELNENVVFVIGDIFKVNAFKLCRENNIPFAPVRKTPIDDNHE